MQSVNKKRYQYIIAKSHPKTSSLWPFGPVLGPSGLLDFVLGALWAHITCDPRSDRHACILDSDCCIHNACIHNAYIHDACIHDACIHQDACIHFISMILGPDVCVCMMYIFMILGPDTYLLTLDPMHVRMMHL